MVEFPFTVSLSIIRQVFLGVALSVCPLLPSFISQACHILNSVVSPYFPRFPCFVFFVLVFSFNNPLFSLLLHLIQLVFIQFTFNFHPLSAHHHLSHLASSPNPLLLFTFPPNSCSFTIFSCFYFVLVPFTPFLSASSSLSFSYILPSSVLFYPSLLSLSLAHSPSIILFFPAFFLTASSSFSSRYPSLLHSLFPLLLFLLPFLSGPLSSSSPFSCSMDEEPTQPRSLSHSSESRKRNLGAAPPCQSLHQVWKTVLVGFPGHSSPR